MRVTVSCGETQMEAWFALRTLNWPLLGTDSWGQGVKLGQAQTWHLLGLAGLGLRVWGHQIHVNLQGSFLHLVAGLGAGREAKETGR